jgi:hypothetical protein
MVRDVHTKLVLLLLFYMCVLLKCVLVLCMNIYIFIAADVVRLSYPRVEAHCDFDKNVTLTACELFQTFDWLLPSHIKRRAGAPIFHRFVGLHDDHNRHR